jgi:hypothetical protein
MRLGENILYTKGEETYFLDHTLFNLDSVYDDVYKMNYITKEHVDTDSVLHTIRFHFSEHNMMRYFGDRANLSCEQTRDGYISMIQYFRNVGLDKLANALGVDIESLSNNDPAMCLIAECMHSIRASIKKYMRYRTSANQPRKCSKETWNARNARTYKCPRRLGVGEYCPTFAYLRKRKTCKAIALDSSGKTNRLVTFLSQFATVSPVDGPIRSLPPENTRVVGLRGTPVPVERRLKKSRKSRAPKVNKSKKAPKQIQPLQSRFLTYIENAETVKPEEKEKEIETPSKWSFERLGCKTRSCINENAHAPLVKYVRGVGMPEFLQHPTVSPITLR